MYNNQFAKNERRIRRRAKLYTGLLFGGVFAATVYFGNGGSLDFSKPTNGTSLVKTKVEQKVNVKPVNVKKTTRKKRKHRGA